MVLKKVIKRKNYEYLHAHLALEKRLTPGENWLQEMAAAKCYFRGATAVFYPAVRIACLTYRNDIYIAVSQILF